MAVSTPPENESDAPMAWDPAMSEAFRELRASTDATDADVARLQSRLGAPPARPWGRVVVAAATLTVGGVGWWAMSGGDPVIELTDDALTVGGVVLAEVAGRGDVRVATDRVHLDWVVGAIRPGTEAVGALVVHTPEADWDVTAPGELLRDQLGTHLIAADDPTLCVGEVEHTEGALTCLPVTATGWLGRAHTLVSGGDARRAILAFEQAANADEPLVVEEARAGLADALVRSGDVARAAVVAEEALAAGATAREIRLHTLAARAYLVLGDCSAALPHLQALPEPSADEAAHAARCAEQIRSH